jgi:uncharacterized protein involved in exopolysaccharide biosynthesis
VPTERSAWTDERLDERMTSLDRTLGLLQNDTSGIGTELVELRREVGEEMRSLRSDLSSQMQQLRSDFSSDVQHLRSDFTAERNQLRSDFTAERNQLRSDFTAEMRHLRSDITSIQDRLVQIGFGLVGVLLVSLCSLVVAAV